MDGFITVERIPKQQWLVPKLALLPTATALRLTRQILKECFYERDLEEYEKLLGLLRDLEWLRGADAAHALIGLKKTSLFFLEFGLAIYGLRLKRI